MPAPSSFIENLLKKAQEAFLAAKKDVAQGQYTTMNVMMVAMPIGYLVLMLIIVALFFFGSSKPKKTAAKKQQ